MQHIAPSHRPQQPKHLWRNDITGLRAIAVLPVLLFHAFPDLLPGGFFGVDVFFVISGYLISGIIFRGILDGSFSYRIFYEKRIKRIVPNLLLLICFVSVMGYFFLLPSEYVNLGKHIYSSAGFFENIRLLKEVDYFTKDALRKPLLHLWSLAIEEQFYIVFPIICVLVWRFTKSSNIIAIVVCLITILSLIACLLVNDSSFNFYFPLTRFWELGTGICLAFVESFGLFRSRNFGLGFRNLLSVIGILSIIVPMLSWTSNMTHPGWITLFPVLGALLIIIATPEAICNRSLLAWRPITFIGLISYSLYLWHWAFLSFLYICVGETSIFLRLSTLILSFLIATVVYFLVEQPVRRIDKSGIFSVSNILLVGLVISIVFGQFLHKMDGFPARKVLPEEVAAARAVNEWMPYQQSTKIVYESVDIAVTSNSEMLPSIVFAGDSHIAQYFNRVKVLSFMTKKPAALIACGGCAIFEREMQSKHQKETIAFYKILSDPKVKTIVIGQAWGQYYKNPKFKGEIAYLKEVIQRRKDIKVFILLDYPWTPTRKDGQQGEFDPLLHAKRLSFNREDFIVPYPDDDTWKRGNEAIVELLSDVASIIPVERYICPENKCDLLKWYKDDDHLQPLRLEKEANWIDQVFIE